MTARRARLGLAGERAAAAWLQGAGWRIVERRHRTPYGELDLVAFDPDGCLVGVEVKLRSSGRAGRGAESIDSRRLGRLRAALGAYALTSSEPRSGLRLDLVELAPEPRDDRWRIRRLPAIDAW